MADKDSQKISHDEEVAKELKAQLTNFGLVVTVIMLLIAFSTWFYHVVEGWNWLDSVYFVFVTMGTVGYGDFTPTSNVSKLYTMFLITVGIGSFAFFAGLLLKRQQLRTLEKQLKRSQKNKEKTEL